ncbi:PREDICTED: autophagy-related protein 18b isoform X1 [Nicotiana attenuata]|uniref:Autophagy-related protein 18b n=1 Tax=Nicotiana attenuata TaxID=49451 RepID=A0A1J6HY49_NICAT|nr:PREDICTED: autophagy-related protein 18b isoform X1 [Nicotiana attenuata]OIS97265.1 autophagy-related protein 18b [Nicotiana attenuata]
MANQPSSYPILCASFNQDNSCFAIGTKEGFKIFDCNTGRLLYERAAGAFIIVEMLFSSSLLAIVGAGEQPSLSPRRLCMFNTTTGVALEELNFLTSILAVRMNKKRLIVILQEKTFIYDINSLKILDTIDTVPNPKGLCAFSPSLDGSYLALPASTTKGSLLVYNVSDLRLHCEIDAHRAPLSVLTLSSGGTHIATASEQGTMIRVHLVSDATKSYSFRRGTYTSNIFSLSFAPAAELPDILLATSSSGSVHVFSLSSPPNQRSSGLLASIIPIPHTVSDALDPAQHCILHRAVPARVRSNTVIRKIEKFDETATPEHVALRATISMITYGGYFLQYIYNVNHQNKSSWTLEREFNLITAETSSLS